MAQIQTKFIANSAVTEAKIATNAVTTNKIADSNVTNAKVATGIDAAKLADGSVSNTEFQYLGGVTSDIQTQLDAKVDESREGAANGIATLDAGGKVPVSQLPNSVMEYLGTWAASTNTPTLSNGTGNAGDVYIASDAGTVDFGAGNITFAAGDWVIYSGSVWQKSVNSNAVASVNGFTGVVVLDTDDIAEGTALYFTDERAQDAVGNNLLDTARIDLSYNDGTGQISADLIADSVDGSFIRLNNDQYLRARNAADSADVNIARVSAADKVLLVDGATLTVFNVTDRTMFDSSNESSAIFESRYLMGPAGVIRYDWGNNQILQGGQVSIDAATRELKDSSGVTSLNYSSGSDITISKTLLPDADGTLEIGASGTAEFNSVYTKSMGTSDSALSIGTGDTDVSITFDKYGGPGTTGVKIGLSDYTNGFYAYLKAPDTLAADYTLTLPTDDGNSGQVLSTNGSGVLSWVTPAVAVTNEKQDFTLSAGDITNQYVDLSNVARTDSIRVVVSGVSQREGSDYTVNYTGGAGGNTRITFAGDLATGGAAELVASDVFQVQYEY